MKNAIILAALALTLSGCAKRNAEAAVRASLNDPDSAKFGEFYYDSTTKRGCLTVNAKNAMGGYVGDQEAYVSEENSTWEEDGIAGTDLEGCKTVWADAAKP